MRQLENQILLKGGEIQILDGQNNLVHCKTHLAAEMPLIEQAQQDPNMLMEVLPGFNALNQHTTAHVEKLSTDPQMQSQAAAFRQQIQQADEIIHNGMMHLAEDAAPNGDTGSASWPGWSADDERKRRERGRGHGSGRWTPRSEARLLTGKPRSNH